MVQMITPWKHPQTGIYYLYKELPPHLRGEMGRRQVRRSLKTRDPAEAKRLFVLAHAELEQEMAAAEARIAAQKVADEISPERAKIIVDDFIRNRHAPERWSRWPTLGLVWWLEDTARRVFNTDFPLAGLPMDDSPEALAAKRGEPVPGDCWLDVVRMYPPAEWLQASGMVLADVFEDQDPAIKRIPANDLLIMQAWNARVLEDNERLRADIAAPRRIAVKPRLRPDLRFRELLQLWNKENAPRPQSYVEVERATEDLIDYLGDIPVESFTSDMLMDYRDEAKNLPATMPRADRALPFTERLARHAHSATAPVSLPTLKQRVGSIQALLSFAHQQRWISQNAGTGVKITGFSRVARGRRSFMPGELAQLFASDLFVRPDRLLDRRTDVSDVTLYWLFLLGLTSGARLEEVGQARVQDVKADGGILYIDIDDLMDAEADPNLPEKSVKTTGSRRIIPIHEHVLTLGFERYVSALKDVGSELLFPDLRPSTFGKLTKEASRRLNRYINAVVSTDARLVFHSLRHRFKDEGRGADVQERVLDQLCGHVPATVGGRYGEGANLQALKRSLDRLRFDSVDWTRLRTATGTISWADIVTEIVGRVKANARKGK